MKLLFGLLFRLFPCPTEPGLRRIGSPGRASPVLVTGNFHLTVHRLTRALAGADAWLLVADSRGINVWCAAGGGDLDARSVAAVVKTSGVASEVDHHTLILPPLGAAGIRAAEVEARTGWRTRWGPVRARDLPAFLEAGDAPRSEAAKRVTWTLPERLDAALGSLFPVLLAAAAGFALLGRSLLPDYLLVAAATFPAYFAVAHRLPGRSGLARSLRLALPLAAALVATELLLPDPAPRPRADLLLALALVLLYGVELGGLSPTLASDLDPFLARRGLQSIGPVAFAGTLRTDLLNGRRRLRHDPERCRGCGECVEVCPQGVWETAGSGLARLARPEACTACTACLEQCPSGAIRAVSGDRPPAT